MRIADGVPVVFLAGSEEPIALDRLSPSDPSVAEHLIQGLVFDHPTVLPIEELDPSFVPAIPIGREIGTAVGPIDALFVSPDGGITIVEAKLWRNPQARREVVGQIIDYATALSAWSYENLDDACVQSAGQPLWTLVSSHSAPGPTNGQAAFIDAVSRNLRHGRFLLLVVGDGIREEVERMAAYVQAAPRLQFHLALVELRIYEADEHGIRAVVPSVVAKTAEITRAVVRVDVADETRVEVDVSVPADDSPRSRRKLTMDQFFAEMTDRATPAEVWFIRNILGEFETEPRYRLLFGAAAVSLRLRNPQGGDGFTVLVINTGGNAYPGWLHGQCKRAGIPEEVAIRFAADLSSIFGIPVHHRHRDTLARHATPEALKENWDAVNDRIQELALEMDHHLE